MLRIKIVLFCSLLLISCEKNPVDNNKSTPPDEERILFVRQVKGKLSQICTIKPDGSDLRVIHETKYSFINRGIHYAIWSPDKSKILFEGEEESLELCPIWIMDSNSGEVLYQLTDNGGSGVWSPDGKHIIFSRMKSWASLINDLYIIDSDGRNERVLFQTDSLSVHATDWSQDTQKLLVGVIHYFYDSENRLNEERPKIGVFDMNTGSIQYIVEDDYLQNFGAKWSPDGSKIVYISGLYTQKYGIYLLDLNTDTTICLTDSLDYYSKVIWSPDSKRIAFTKRNSNLTGRFGTCDDIFVMDIETRSIINITNTASDSISSEVMDWK